MDLPLLVICRQIPPVLGPTGGGDPNRRVAPESALVVIRDIAGWWQDCGCAGTAVGGVGRLRATAGGATRVDYLFVGRTVLPFREGQSTGDDAKAAPWFEAAALAVFEALGHVHWIPDNLERKLLLTNANAPLARYAVNQSLEWRGVKLEYSGEWLNLSHSAHRLSLPPPRDRAREVGVLAKWNESSSNSSDWSFSERLGTVVPLASRFPKAREEAFSILESSTGHVLSWWRRQIVNDLEVDESVQQRAVETTLAVVHAPGTQTGYVPGTGWQQTVAEQKQACGRCHIDAHAHWAQSPHAKAMATLRARMKHSDLRCLPCHTQEYSVHADGGHATMGKDAVTCQSCHKPGRNPRNVCLDCHTKITDPGESYKRNLETACPGGVNREVQEACERG
jgi:hypothetical protein